MFEDLNTELFPFVLNIGFATSDTNTTEDKRQHIVWKDLPEQADIAEIH